MAPVLRVGRVGNLKHPFIQTHYMFNNKECLTLALLMFPECLHSSAISTDTLKIPVHHTTICCFTAAFLCCTRWVQHLTPIC